MSRMSAFIDATIRCIPPTLAQSRRLLTSHRKARRVSVSPRLMVENLMLYIGSHSVLAARCNPVAV